MTIVVSCFMNAVLPGWTGLHLQVTPGLGSSLSLPSFSLLLQALGPSSPCSHKELDMTEQLSHTNLSVTDNLSHCLHLHLFFLSVE